MSESAQCFQCSHIGVSTDGTKVEEVRTSMGQHYFKATVEKVYLFGSEVNCALVGIGRTKEQALQRLESEKRNLSDSLWA